MATKFPLGYGPMDSVHEEFEIAVAVAANSQEDDLGRNLHSLRAHLLEHFATEDSWMRSTAFPAATCHMDEHAQVLASANEVIRLVETGNFSVGLAFATALQQWFPGHAAYLDSALAAWMCKLKYGAQAVVLHGRPLAVKRQGVLS